MGTSTCSTANSQATSLKLKAGYRFLFPHKEPVLPVAGRPASHPNVHEDGHSHAEISAYRLVDLVSDLDLDMLQWWKVQESY